LHGTAQLYEESIQEHDWLLMSELLPALRQAEDHYCRLAGLELPYGS